MGKNPFIHSYPRRVNKPQPNKSAGILDDFAVRKVVATKEGSITRTPTEDIDIANKKYVDDEIGSDHPHQDVTTTADPTFNTITTTAEANLGGWTGMPSPISTHSNIAGDLFCGNTGVDTARFRMSSNATKGFLQFNRYWDGSAPQQMDASKSTFTITMDSGVSDYMFIGHSPAGDTTLSTLFQISGSGAVEINSGTLNMNTHKILNVTDPTADQEAATKKYVDDQIATVVTTGATGSFTAGSGETITVADGLITFITSSTFLILLETGDKILMENGDNIENG